jgi:hypothetical protein
MESGKEWGWHEVWVRGALTGDQDPVAAATGGGRCELGTRMQGGGTVGRLVVGQPSGRRKWARPSLKRVQTNSNGFKYDSNDFNTI